MKAVKRKRVAAPARAETAVIHDVAEQAVPAVVVANLEVAPAPAMSAAQPVALPTVTLGSNCTVKDAAALKQSLCAVLGSDAAVVIDVSSLERIDTAAIQVLCAFVRQRAVDSRSVTWLGIPVALREAANLLGVGELLMLPAAAGAAP